MSTDFLADGQLYSQCDECSVCGQLYGAPVTAAEFGHVAANDTDGNGHRRNERVTTWQNQSSDFAGCCYWLTLRGVSFPSEPVPIYPLTEANPGIWGTVHQGATCLDREASSFIDAMELIKITFGLSTINYNLNNVRYINSLGNTITNGDYVATTPDSVYTPLTHDNILISTASSGWARPYGIYIGVEELLLDEPACASQPEPKVSKLRFTAMLGIEPLKDALPRSPARRSTCAAAPTGTASALARAGR